MKLRDYQRECVDSIGAYFEASTGNPLLVLPTGAGKSVIQAAFIQETLAQWPETRFLLLTHVRELIVQNESKLQSFGMSTGVYCAGLGRSETDKPVTLASIQSVYRKAHEMGDVALVVVDEAHLVGKRTSGMYRDFLRDLARFCPQVKVIGMTATPFRLDSGSLIKGEERIFTDIAYEIGIKRLIDEGYLCPLVTAETSKMDTRNVKQAGGEYVLSSLQGAVNLPDVTGAALNEVERLCEDRASWLVFCVGVEHATEVARDLQTRGHVTEVILGNTARGARDASIERFKGRKIRALVSVGVLTTGFDAPGTDAIVCLRPTLSPGLWVQMVGRGSRTAYGKKDCLVLDFAGNTERHGPIDLISVEKDGEVKPAPALECPTCGTANKPGATLCKKCTYRFLRDCKHCGAAVPKSVQQCPECKRWLPEPREAQHGDKASGGELLSSDETIEYDVTRWWAERHKKEGKPDSARVSYATASHTFCEWLCFDHGGYATDKARAWWGPGAPESTEEALGRFGELEQPCWIAVKRDGKYWRVVKRETVPF